MEEYKRLYELYLAKSDAELQDILKPENGYTPSAIKAASDILKYGRITCEQSIANQDGIIIFPTQEIMQKQPSKKIPAWLLIICIIFGIIAGAVLMSGISDLSKSSKPENEIIGCYYVGSITGSASYYGLIFYFYAENTFRYTTETASRIGYGTYEIDGSALTLKTSTDTYATVITNNGNKIMISDTELNKVIERDLISSYKKLFETAD